MTRLYQAAFQGNLEKVVTFLNEGDNPNDKEQDGSSPLHAVLEKNKDLDTRFKIAKILLDKGANIDNQDNNGYTVLHWVSLKHSFEKVDFLLEHGANVHLTTNQDDTALHCATRMLIEGEIDYSKTMESLLQAGADIDAVNSVQFTPRNYILLGGRKEILYLIDKYGNQKAPKLSENEQNLAHLLTKMSPFLSNANKKTEDMDDISTNVPKSTN